MKFTKEEINLCKQIAEKHRKKIGKGVWYISKGSDYKTGWSNPMLNTSHYEPVKKKLVGVFNDKDRIDVPLWTISNCLEFLNQRDSHCVLLGWVGKTKRSKRYCHVYIANNIHEAEGFTYLETLLKAVLAVLEEK